MVVEKHKPSEILDAILNSIKTEGRNGTFGNYTVDVGSVTGAGKCGKLLLVMASMASNIWESTAVEALVISFCPCWAYT